MNYLLVKEEQMEGQGYDYRFAERIPDGRIILPLSALKVLSNFMPEIIADDKLKALIEEQKESSLYGSSKEQSMEEEPGEDTVAEDEVALSNELPAASEDEATLNSELPAASEDETTLAGEEEATGKGGEA